MFRQMLGRWEGRTPTVGIVDFDRLTLAVAESGIIVERFRAGKSVRKELYPLTGSRLIGSVYLFPSSPYFVKEIYPEKMVFGRGAFGTDVEFLMVLNRVSKKK